MILSLAVRFKKHIAALLFGLCLVQATIAERVNSHYLILPPAYSPIWAGIGLGLNGSLPGERTPVSANAGKNVMTASSNNKKAQPFIGGPGQPEMQSFQSVNANNMVDLFSGDFSYNIPLLDVGGYPVNIAYHSGITMDEEASWVGLGWNINPGTVSRNMRGVPDDFNGGSDTMRKVASIKPNYTWGANAGAGVEIVGLPVGLGASMGLFHSTYNGWGIESALNASINAGGKAHGTLTAGLSITNNSQNGITLNPSLSARMDVHQKNDNAGAGVGVSVSAPYNSRTGLKSIQIGMDVQARNQYRDKNKKVVGSGRWGMFDGGLTFNWPTYNPTITMPMTNLNFSFSTKFGIEIYTVTPHFSFTGYAGKEYIAADDTSFAIPVFGYLNFQNIGDNRAALTDFNREKEMHYREKPAIPHIAVPSYTYDVFSISGEGTGGSFRPYRGDVGFIADHLIKNKTITGGFSVDVGIGSLVHVGTDLNANYSTTQTGPWLSENILANSIAFRKNKGLYEAVYFRNPGEKTINSTAFYDALGGDDVVAPRLFQQGKSDPSIKAINKLTRWKDKQETGTIDINRETALRTARDKRSQVISYLTAGEASTAGISKRIEHYLINQFITDYCIEETAEEINGKGTGLIGYYYNNPTLKGTPDRSRLDKTISFFWDKGTPFTAVTNGNYPNNNFSVRWVGRLKAPATGKYSFGIFTDDGARLWINDSLVINGWKNQPATWYTTNLNLVKDRVYTFRMEYYEGGNQSVCELGWKRPDQPDRPFEARNKDAIPAEFLYLPKTKFVDTVNDIVVREDRVNAFRKASHLSQIDVLNPDGRRYVYATPVYNLQQKEVSFAIDPGQGNTQTGLTRYNAANDASVKNNNGKDNYYSREEIPAYAHSFLLNGILSSDYVDITGDGITDDDLGDAVKFNYSKACGIDNPYQWRVPYVQDSANYSQGLKTYSRDDKAHYIYGTKEMWYLHSIESKTMIANFTMQPRADMLEIGEHGQKYNNAKAWCLKKIDLYSKADFLKNHGNATPIKTVHFEYSYELCRGINGAVNDSGKLTLKKIWFTYNGNNKGQQNPYKFFYHPNNPRFTTNAGDKWGTYKSPGQNPGATVDNPISNADYPHALQDSALAAYNAGAWMLDSIKLPSGGRIKVKYESDDYAYVQNRRSAQLFKLAGFGKNASGTYSDELYTFDNAARTSTTDQVYAYVKIPYPVSNLQELRARYLEGITKLFFKVFVHMPSDAFGSGSEYVPCYADTAAANWYGITDANTIWVKLAGVNKNANGSGSLSPVAQATVNYLRMNLPSKAYPGSEFDDNMSAVDGVKMLLSQVFNVVELLNGFSKTARTLGWARKIDTSRSYIRLNCPTLKKMGGGLRVKTVLIYDHWNAMTGKKETIYGQNYDYTTTQRINGKTVAISSGVATWEPSVGGDENPFHLPIEYVDRVSLLAPAAAMFSEEPLGESFFPAASVGYSQIRMRTVRAQKTRSANGFTETRFYTSYDFPTTWDWSLIDDNSKKRFNPPLANFLRINARHFLTLSQGFKVELNDMNGKMRSQAIYPEVDSTAISYTENFYRVDNQAVTTKHLNNVVSTIDPSGNIDTASTIGKDVELMADMRDQTSVSIGGNINVNIDVFTIGPIPTVIPSVFGLYQRETNQFRSAAMMKIIHRYGILDSVVHTEKGSLISTKNLLYDSETGEVVLSRTQNEFNDPLYQFSYPAHWVYNGMAPAYRNIGAVLENLLVIEGKITGGLQGADTTYLTAGDELLVYSKQTISNNCADTPYASFRNDYKLWVIDSNTVNGGPQRLFLIDQFGKPFGGKDVNVKVIRSGRRNMSQEIGTIASLGNPMVKDGANYKLVFDTATRVINASAAEFKQFWQVSDKKRVDKFTDCVYTAEDSAQAAAEACDCIKPFLDYIIASNKLYPIKFIAKRVGVLVNEAIAAGYPINLSNCPILSNNVNEKFYTSTIRKPDQHVYKAHIGKVSFDLISRSGYPQNFSRLTSSYCSPAGVIYKDPTLEVPEPDTVTVRFVPDFSVNLLSSNGECPLFLDTLLITDSVSDRMLVETDLVINGSKRNAVSIFRFDRLKQIPQQATLLQARLVLQADHRGHYPPDLPNANSVNPIDSMSIALTAPSGWFPYLPLEEITDQSYYSEWHKKVSKETPFQNDTINMVDYLGAYLQGMYNSSTFILTQGSEDLHALWDSSGEEHDYRQSGYSNYYSTFYSRHYSDDTKRPALEVTYINPAPLVDTLGAILVYNSTINCTDITSRPCYSAVTDTTVNPYQYGILGNFRPVRSYVYYGRRKESDPVPSTNIRTAGTIQNFAPFWTLQDNRWAPSYDTTRWVWNSETSLFNRKGFELENKDPLGRYNSGIYGYGLTMPVAVLQNSHFQEGLFEGFEDYDFNTHNCDNECSVTRPFDFGAYQSSFTTARAHTGLYSLRIGKDSSISMAVNLSAAAYTQAFTLASSEKADVCPGVKFDGMVASQNTLLPNFSPIAGKRMVVGAWVKEDTACHCSSYTRNHIILSFVQGESTTTLTLSPSGNIVEGWQRYEAVVDIPSNATQLVVTMEASDSSVTYFDDLRIHPYNAHMKSYVYNPVNLRLMAELDERNYSTLYEYDDDGTLIRLKKETERGVQTIKETRSALIKEQ